MRELKILPLAALGALVVIASQTTKRPTTTAPAKPKAPGGSTALPGAGTPGGGLVYIPTPTATVTYDPLPGGSTAPAPAAGNGAAGPSWAGEPTGVTTHSISQLVVLLSAFLLKQNPAYWAIRPTARREFAAHLVMAAQNEKYPLDLLIGHAWAEGLLKPQPVPNGAGAVGPLQVTRIACADVGRPYPPANAYEGVVTGIRYLRLNAKRHGLASLTDALRCYGLGYGGLLEFKKYGCTGKPCERPQSVWRAECGCLSGGSYTVKVRTMAGRAAAAGFHTMPWAAWRGS